ncbi:MAG: TetR/AcrR family transcriptional regulator [Sandaracinaceae bacterium]|nr:TetR/AcrR family transcriptional regulator [Sandaracinaceae bacterium]
MATSRKKRPKQARSKATVDAIVEATGQIFEKEGFKKTTTTRVAERAGVSVGSLYQYFPDKQTLIAAFFERRLEQDVALLQSVLTRVQPGTSPGELLRVAAQELVRVYRDDRELYASVVEILPLMEQTDEVRTGIARAVGLASGYLRMYPDVLGDRDPELLALVAFHGLRGALNAIIAHAPEKLDDPHLEASLTGAAFGFLGLPDDDARK